MSASEPRSGPLRSLLRSLAQDAERLELHAADVSRQSVIILPESLDGSGLGVVTLLPTEPEPPLLKPGHEIHLHGHLLGAPVHLVARLRRLLPGRREWRFDLALPHLMDYRERREIFRVPVAENHPAAVAVLLSPAEALLATVTDLSREGIGLRLRAAGAQLPDEDRLLRCEIGRDDQRIHARLVVCHQRLQAGHSHLGGRLQPDSSTDSRRLDDLVAELERLWLRRRQDRRPLR